MVKLQDVARKTRTKIEAEIEGFPMVFEPLDGHNLTLLTTYAEKSGVEADKAANDLLKIYMERNFEEVTDEGVKELPLNFTLQVLEKIMECNGFDKLGKGSK